MPMPPPSQHHQYTSSPTALGLSLTHRRTLSTVSARPPSPTSSVLSEPARPRLSAGILTTTATSTLSSAAGRRKTARIAATITTNPAVCPDVAFSTASPPVSPLPLPRYPLKLAAACQNAPVVKSPLNPNANASADPSPALYPLAAPRMPSYDPQRPPVLASTRQSSIARNANKPPLTPKLASSRSQTPLHHSPSVIGSRRDPPTLTPRASSRQIRVDSNHSTPTITPRLPKVSDDYWETRSTAGTPEDTPKGPVVNVTSPSDAGTPGRSDKDLDSKFFYASDAHAQKKAQQQHYQQPQPQPQQQQQQQQQQQHRAQPTPTASNFFYANGNSVASPQGPLSPPLASPAAPDSLNSKFVYANGTPELQPAPKISPARHKRSGSVVSTASRAPTGAARPTSPAKPTQCSQLPSTRTSTPSLVSPKSPTVNLASQAGPRRVSGELPLRAPKQDRPKSATPAELSVSGRRISSHSSLPSSGSASPTNNRPVSLPGPGFASLAQVAEDFAASDDSHGPSLANPNRTSQDNEVDDIVANARRERKVQDLEITNASLAAINRSLERQLRKQTAELRRYQRLSRAGRLSFMPSDTPVEGGVLAKAGKSLDDLDEDDDDDFLSAEEPSPSDISDEEEEEEDDDDLSDNLSGVEEAPAATMTAPSQPTESRGMPEKPVVDGQTDSNSNINISNSENPNTELNIKEIEKKHRRIQRAKRDERRLQLDLTRHQQLLITSQKINQSIRRCLNWTEELIKEGQRALAYKVNVSDVSLGGRVLAPEEVERRERGIEGDEDDGDADGGVFYGVGGRTETEEESEMESEEETDEEEERPRSKAAQDRDSGIDFPADDGIVGVEGKRISLPN